MLDVNERQCVNIKFDSTVPGTRAVKYLSENIEIWRAAPSVIFSQCGEGGHSSNRAAIIEGKSAHNIVALPQKTLVMGAGAWSPSQLCWIKATMTKKVFYSSYLVSFYSCAWSFRSFQVFAYHIKHMYADFVRNSSMAKASLNSKEHSEELLLKWLKSRERGNGGCGS